MHELSIAENLAGIVIGAAEKEGLSAVSSVNVCIGQLTQVVPDIFNTAFMMAVEGTIAGKAALNIEIIPAILKCRDCGKEFPLSETFFRCYYCGSPETDIIGGRELFVKTIEGE